MPSPTPLRFLRWVKTRRGHSAPARWLGRAALALWKTARLIPGLNRLTIPVQVDGHHLRIRAFSYDDLLTASDDYEPSLAAALPPPGGTAIDAGAFIGRHSLAYARAVGSAGRVVAVEPLPANFRLLEHNVARNGYTQVTCVRCALGAANGQIDLAYDRETSTASAVRPLPRRLRVGLRTLDSLAEELGIDRIDLLKIDVEGAERDVLEGAQRLLAASPQARLAIEIHPWAVAPDGRCPVSDWLAQRGYHIDRLHDGQRLYYLASRHAEERGCDDGSA